MITNYGYWAVGYGFIPGWIGMRPYGNYWTKDNATNDAIFAGYCGA